MSLRFSSKLKDVSLKPCIGILSKNYFIWCPLHLSEESTRQVYLPNVVCVFSVNDLPVSDFNEKVFKLDVNALRFANGLFGFVVAKIVSRGLNKWHIENHIFWCDTHEECNRWIRVLKSTIAFSYPSRPRKLLVFINPSSGHKVAERIYDNTVGPLFHLSGIDTSVIVTTHRDHATEHLMSNSLKGFDGVICVGGDGFFSELVQGLLLRERLDACLPIYSAHKPGEIELPATLRIGIIPAGSTDTVAFSTHGSNDVLTAALHIIIGDDLALDVAAIHCGDSGDLLRYAVSMVGYGFHADLLKSDDKLRWMGPRRYDFSGFSTFLSHSVYSGEISYLPSSNRNSYSTDGVSCYSGCSVCSTSAGSQDSTTQFDQFSDSSPSILNGKLVKSNELAHIYSSSTSTGLSNDNCDAKLDDTSRKVKFFLGAKGMAHRWASTYSQPSLHPIPVSNLKNQSSLSSGNLLSIRDRRSRCSPQTHYWFRKHKTTSLHPSPRITPPEIDLFPSVQRVSPSPSWSLQGCPLGWVTVSGRFIAVNAFVQSCRCVKACRGPAPWAHLGDGCLDLILVNECSRRQFLQFLLRISRGPSSRHIHNKNLRSSMFDLPFVTVQRVCAFRFRPFSSSHPLYTDRRHRCKLRFQKTGKPLLDRDVGDLHLSDAEGGGTLENSSLSLNTVAKDISNHQDPQHNKSVRHDLSKNREFSRTASIWCADGELVRQSNVDVFVHRQLIRIFARGPEFTELSTQGVGRSFVGGISLVSVESVDDITDFRRQQLSNHCSSPLLGVMHNTLQLVD